MPIYEYECDACNHTFEHFARSAADEKNAACPKCSSRRAHRRPSVFSARSASQPTPSLPRAGGCGRCGDPNGPCSIN